MSSTFNESFTIKGEQLLKKIKELIEEGNVRKITIHDKAGKEVMTFKRMAPETAEFQVVFSDYRSVNGVQLPFHWVQTVASVLDETFDVTSYEINPANIAEKFLQPKQMMRMKKPEIQ